MLRSAGETGPCNVAGLLQTPPGQEEKGEEMEWGKYRDPRRKRASGRDCTGLERGGEHSVDARATLGKWDSWSGGRKAE